MPETSKKTLNDFGVSVDEIRVAFEEKMRTKSQIQDLKHIFEIALNNLSLFPNIKDASSYQDYLERWIKSYETAMTNLPSQRKASPKSSCSDPAIKVIVQTVTNVDDQTAEKQNSIHNLFMSAENIQGNLLEEYISSVVCKYGWYWCAGNILKAVDFCTPNGPTFIQIKNKSNTENSSSSAIRDGTDIQKWYRLGTKTAHGKKVPDYKWKKLNSIINAHSSKPDEECAMSEGLYQAFLNNATKNNPDIITDQ